MTNQDTINVDLPIRAEGDGDVSVLGYNLSRKYWREVAVDPSSALTERTRVLAPAVVAWIERDEWKPLDVPEVGRTIKATLRDGSVKTFEVERVHDIGSRWVQVIAKDPHFYYFIELKPDPHKRHPDDIIAWEYVDETAVDLAAIADKIAAAVNELREAIG